MFDLNFIGNCCCLRGSFVKERGMFVKTVLYNLFFLNINDCIKFLIFYFVIKSIYEFKVVEALFWDKFVFILKFNKKKKKKE